MAKIMGPDQLNLLYDQGKYAECREECYILGDSCDLEDESPYIPILAKWARPNNPFDLRERAIWVLLSRWYCKNGDAISSAREALESKLMKTWDQVEIADAHFYLEENKDLETWNAQHMLRRQACRGLGEVSISDNYYDAKLLLKIANSPDEWEGTRKVALQHLYKVYCPDKYEVLEFREDYFSEIDWASPKTIELCKEIEQIIDEYWAGRSENSGNIMTNSGGQS